MKHKKKLKILLADDEKTIRITLGDDLKGAGHEVVDVGHGTDALQLAEERTFDVVITDIRMPGADGIDVLRRVKELHQETEVILITGFGTIESAVEAMRLGAYHYILKPFLNKDILICIEKIAQVKQLEEDNRRLKDRLGKLAGVEGLIGSSREMQEILKVIRTVAKSSASVLIHGESGTGKEIIARTIHLNSLRPDDKFVAISCGALPATLLESELFGHEKGAFTDAHKMRKGWFELADGGTVFLDDIDDMPMETQVKLLRTLQEREIVRVGGEKTQKVDFRIISATKRELQEMMASGEFREDLFYRLNVVPLEVPPLRQRTEDIPLLVTHFIGIYRAEDRAYEIKPEVMDALMRYPWPGNVRELENAVERAIVLSGDSKYLKKENLLKPSGQFKTAAALPAKPKTLKETVFEAERAHIKEVLRMTGGHKAQAASILGISRKNLWEKLRDYNIEV
ncbi:MAG: sigma-54-dependent transcriptional regulator [Planctomycetota bacterium]|jgi:DNA-binding NtrC family response regulator